MSDNAAFPLLWERLLTLVLGLYPAAYLAVLLHESGHALAGRLAGFRIGAFGLGTARPFFHTRLPGGTIVYLCRDNPLFGICWPLSSEILPARSRHALFIAGGALANLIVVAPFLWLWSRNGSELGLIFALVNLLLGFVNLLPIAQRIGDTAISFGSDGLRVVRLFLATRDRADLPSSYLAHRALHESIGDTRTLRNRYSLAAIAALNLGDTEATGEYIVAAKQLPADDSDGLIAYAEGIWRLERGENEAARGSLTEAIARFSGERATGSALAADWMRLRTEDDVLAAITEGKRIAERLDAGPIHPPRLALLLAQTHLMLFLKRPGENTGAELETLLARYEAARRRTRSDTMDAETYTAVSAWLSRQGDTARARITWGNAITACRGVDTAIATDPPLRERYRRRIDDQAIAAGLPSPFADQNDALHWPPA